MCLWSNYYVTGTDDSAHIRTSGIAATPYCYAASNLNPYTYKGEAGSAVINDTLLTSSLDEPSTEYGLVAASVWHPDDRSQVVFRLRPEARFHDGEPVKPEDVIFSMQSLKKNSTQYAAYYKNVDTVEKTGDHEVTFTFSMKGNRELPQITGQLPVLPKHWWEGKDASGKQRDVSSNTLEPLLGSGPYQIAAVRPGLSISVKRFENYWGKDLPVNKGYSNFDEIETQFYQDRNILLEAFKGDQFDIQFESSSKQWATGYDFPAAKDGRVIREEIPRLGVSGMQAWVMNIRRPLFADMRVRRALDLAFDFDWSNANLRCCGGARAANSRPRWRDWTSDAASRCLPRSIATFLPQHNGRWWGCRGRRKGILGQALFG